MPALMIYLSGIATGVFLTFVGFAIRGTYLLKRDSELPFGDKVVFADDGFAYWRNENGFFKAPLIDDEPDFDNRVVLDIMNVPLDELYKLMEINSHLE